MLSKLKSKKKIIIIGVAIIAFFFVYQITIRQPKIERNRQIALEQARVAEERSIEAERIKKEENDRIEAERIEKEERKRIADERNQKMIDENEADIVAVLKKYRTGVEKQIEFTIISCLVPGKMYDFLIPFGSYFTKAGLVTVGWKVALSHSNMVFEDENNVRVDGEFEFTIYDIEKNKFRDAPYIGRLVFIMKKIDGEWYIDDFEEDERIK